MKTEHTPGPWHDPEEPIANFLRIARAHVAEGIPAFDEAFAAAEQSLLETRAADYGCGYAAGIMAERVKVTSKNVRDESVKQGSPELLTELEAICAEAESWHSVHGHDYPGSTQCDAICERIPTMRAAIKKAKGGEFEISQNVRTLQQAD